MAGDRGTSDEIARTAVRALLAGRASSVDEAIDLAAETHGMDRRAPRPSRAQLRAHAQALEESEGGDLARRLRIEETFGEILRVLSILDEVRIVVDPDSADHGPPAVYGRAARGEFDLDPAVHIRVVTGVPSHTLAQALSDAGFGETAVGTIRTRYGHLDEITFETARAAYAVTRIPPRAAVAPHLDLVRGKPVESADSEAILRRMPRFGNHGHQSP